MHLIPSLGMEDLAESGESLCVSGQHGLQSKLQNSKV